MVLRGESGVNSSNWLCHTLSGPDYNRASIIGAIGTILVIVMLDVSLTECRARGSVHITYHQISSHAKLSVYIDMISFMTSLRTVTEESRETSGLVLLVPSNEP